MKKIFILGALLPFFWVSCGNKKNQENKKTDSTAISMKEKVDQYAVVELKADLAKFSDKEKQLIGILIDIADIMDDLAWDQSLGDKKAFLDTIKDPDVKRFAEINYGPWDRLGDNKPFVNGIGEKPAGANFYPKDMTKEEFEKLDNKDKTSLYTMIRRDKEGKLNVIWFHEYYKKQLTKASELLMKASELTDDKVFRNYLQLRSKALLTSNYQASDFLWMDNKTSRIEFVVGPIENYEDQLFGYKATFESFVLIKDEEWSNNLKRFAALLPKLQKELPVDEKYKKESPGADSDMNVYEALYYAGDCNSGSKTIAINLPNDEEVQLKKGTRKLQLKNSMQAKFDKILLPISKQLLDPAQQQYVKFDAFFHNVMFHEVAHGLGVKNTINGKGTVRDALKENYSSIEEAKADILGLYLVTKLREMGKIKEGDLKENYASFVSGIFRSVRFGAASAHGKANMLEFQFLMENKAISRNDKGYYTINFDNMPKAVEKMVAKIIALQGEGDIDGAASWIKDKGVIPADLQKDLDKLQSAKIPVDIVFSQGKKVLGL